MGAQLTPPHSCVPYASSEAGIESSLAVQELLLSFSPPVLSSVCFPCLSISTSSSLLFLTSPKMSAPSFDIPKECKAGVVVDEGPNFRVEVKMVPVPEIGIAPLA
jgi:hypothetical protein